MDGRNDFLEIKKHCTLKKTVLWKGKKKIYKEKIFLGTTTLDHSLFL